MLKKKHQAQEAAPELAKTQTASRREAVLALSIFAVCFTFYALTAAPTVTGEDAGELAAAAATLGVPHPPGYPLYVLAGKLAVTLLPFGEPAYRLNLLSGFFMALAAALLYLLCSRIGAEKLPAASAALLAAFSGTVWSQATITEVYALSAFVFLLLLHGCLSFLKAPSLPNLLVVSYLFGLSLTAHPSLVLIGPALLVLVLLRRAALLLRPAAVLSSAAFFLLGLSLYLYLPLRSLADPPMDWGNPETLSGFLSHLLRRQYAGLIKPPLHPVLDRLAYLVRLGFVEVGPLITLPALFGLGSLLRTEVGRRRAFRLAGLAALGAFSLGLLFFLSVRFEKQTLDLNRVFFIPLVFLLSVPGAFGLRNLARALGPLGSRALYPLCVGGLLLWQYPLRDRSCSTLAREYAEAVLGTLPPNSIFIPTGDYATFPVLYLQFVENRRPDVIVADKYGYLDPAVLSDLGASPSELARLRSMPRAQAQRWLIDKAGRPVFVNAKQAISQIPTERFQPVGILYRVDRQRKPLSPSEEEKLWRSYRFTQLDSHYRWKGSRRDSAEDCILADILTHRAESLFAWGKPQQALQVLQRLKQIGAPYREILQNTGSLLAEKKLYTQAFEFYRAALKVDPGYATCRRNYARALLEWGGNPQLGIEVAERSLAELPPDPDLLKLLAAAYRKAGRLRAARQVYLLASRLDPADPEPLRLAGRITEKELGDPKAARVLYKESLKRLPTQPDLIEKVYGEAARKRYEARLKEILKVMEGESIPEIPRFPQGLHTPRALEPQDKGALGGKETQNG